MGIMVKTTRTQFSYFSSPRRIVRMQPVYYCYQNSVVPEHLNSEYCKIVFVFYVIIMYSICFENEVLPGFRRQSKRGKRDVARI